MLSSIGKPRLSKSAEINNVLLAICKSMASGVVMDHPQKARSQKYNRCWRLWSLWGLPWLVQCANLGQWWSCLDLSHYSEIPRKFTLECGRGQFGSLSVFHGDRKTHSALPETQV